MIYLKLFIEFFKTGLLAVGGGMSTIPFLIKIGEKTSWYSAEELANMIAVTESTPGPIGINVATYVGFSISGVLGALVATFSLILPSVIIILAISAFWKKYATNVVVNTVFHFLRAAVVGLIAYALYSVIVISLFDTYNSIDIKKVFAMIAIFICALMFKKIHPIFWIFFGGLLGLFLF